MPPHVLNTIILIIALLLYLYACRIIIDDARHNYSITMGAEMLFSHLWFLAGLLAVIGVIRLLQLSWWLFLPAVVILYLVSFPVRSWIDVLFRGRDLDPVKPAGFKAFEQKLKDRDGPQS